MCTIYVYFHLVYVILNKYSYLALNSQTRFFVYSFIGYLPWHVFECAVQTRYYSPHSHPTCVTKVSEYDGMTLSDGPSFRVKIQYLTFVFHWGDRGVQVRSRNNKVSEYEDLITEETKINIDICLCIRYILVWL